MIDNFASVGFNVSIDGAVAKRFEYLRHGAVWKEVCENLDYHSKESSYCNWCYTYYYNLNVMYCRVHKIFKERWLQV